MTEIVSQVPKLGAKTCSSCAHSFIDGDKVFRCKAHPPAMHVLWGRDPNSGQPIVAGTLTVFPQVFPDLSCGDHILVAVKNLRDGVSQS